MVRGEMPPRLSKVEFGTYSLMSKAMFRTIPLMRISIKKEHDIGML